MTDSALERQLSRVARGGVIGLIGAVVSAAAQFGVVVLVARGFDAGEAGRFFAVSAVFLMVVAVSTLGTEAGFARFLMRYEAQGRAGAAWRAVEAGCLPTLGLSFLLCAAGLAISSTDLLGGGRSTQQFIIVLSFALPFAVAADLALSVIRAFGRMRTTVVVDRILRAGLQLLTTSLVVAYGGSPASLVIGWASAYVVSALVAVPLAIFFLRRRLPLRVEKASYSARSVAKEFWSYTGYRGAARVAQISIQKADTVIVAAVVSPTAAALYTAATRFVAVGQMGTQALQQVMQPRLTAILLRKDDRLLVDVQRTVTAWTMLLVWPVYATVGAAPLVYLAMFGDEYMTTSTVVTVVVMSTVMLYAVATGPVDTLLIMAGRSGLSLANAVAALVVDIALCLALLPVVGVVGAAIAWACAVTLRCSLAVRQVRHDPGVPFGGREPALAAVLALACFALPSGLWSATRSENLWLWAGMAVLGGAAYLLLLHRFRTQLRLDLLVTALLRNKKKGSSALRKLTGRLRKKLPGSVVTMVRRVVLWWGMATVRWRMTPTFLVAGAQRSGTTTLFRLLAEHPNLVRPTLDKGTGYFDDNHHRGMRWYRAHFPLRALARWRAHHDGPLDTFEVSGYYMFHPLAPGRIAAELPGVKVVVMLRNPIDRAVSAHGHERARGFEPDTLGEALAAEPKRLAGEVERLRTDEHYRSFAHRHHAYLGRGEYAGQVAQLMSALGRDRVYVLDADAFFADPRREFAALQEWLGLPEWIPDQVDRWNATQREPVPPAWRNRLDRHFEPHDRALAQLIGRTPSWRLPRRENR